MKKKSERGITLIALIITIIVMLILVAVAVRVAVNSGLFGHAKNATTRWADEQRKEGEISIDDQIKKYTNDGNEIYAALYGNETEATLVLQNTPNFKEENLVKIYADALGTPIDINEIDVKIQNASINEKYSICSNWTTTDLKNTNDARIIKVARMPIITNLPWSQAEDIITCVDIRTKIIPKNTNYWFAELHNVVRINNIKNLDTSKVTDMSGMFAYCSQIESLDLKNFNTSNVTNMSGMFFDCTNLTTLNLSSFNTSNATSMASMFHNCSNLTTLDLSTFDTSNVTSMASMFYNCSNLTTLDLSTFDTNNVTNMSSMFFKCMELETLDLSSFNTTNVNEMHAMFFGCNLTILDLSSFDMSNVTVKSSMFCNSLKFNIIYVKDETTKTQISNGTDLLSTCQVIVKESGTTI